MPNILYMTVSRDGFIARTNDETPWGDDSWSAFREFVKSCDVILLGKRTYEIMDAGKEFVEGPEYIVITNDSSFNTGNLKKLSISSRADMPQVAKLGIIGGGDLNGRLAELDIIDEVILDTEPIDLKAGIKLFGDHDVNPKLELIDSRTLGESTLQRHYKVARSEKD